LALCGPFFITLGARSVRGSNVRTDVAHRGDRDCHVVGGSLWIDGIDWFDGSPARGPGGDRGRVRSNEALSRTGSGVDCPGVQQQ
jgi:hypothetical protein